MRSSWGTGEEEGWESNPLNKGGGLDFALVMAKIEEIATHRYQYSQASYPRCYGSPFIAND